MQTEAAEAKRSFQAQAEVAVADPETLIAQVFEHLVEHGAEITPIEQGSSATFFLGEVSIPSSMTRSSNVSAWSNRMSRVTSPMASTRIFLRPSTTGCRRPEGSASDLTGSS